MSWVRIDDAFPDHPKVAPLSDAAFRLHVSGLCYCGRFLTDGLIPAAQVRRLYPGDTDALVGELQAAGLWQQEPGGWRVHDFGDFNPTRAEVLARRAAHDKAARLGGQARAAAAGREGGRFTSGATSRTTSGVTSGSAGAAAETPHQRDHQPRPPTPSPTRTRENATDNDPLRTSGAPGAAAGGQPKVDGGEASVRVRTGVERLGETATYRAVQDRMHREETR